MKTIKKTILSFTLVFFMMILPVGDMHWRNPAVLYGNYGTVYCKNLYGSQKTSALYHKGE